MRFGRTARRPCCEATHTKTILDRILHPNDPLWIHAPKPDTGRYAALREAINERLSELEW